MNYRSEFKRGEAVYQVQEIFSPDQWEAKKMKLEEWDWSFCENESVFACDSNGNFFTLKEDSVFFLDHETDERTHLADSLLDFFERLEEPEDLNITLKPGQVKSVWVDPDFKPEFD